jgi:septal ring factor EnvC (AmiA/AmiB activator)
MINYTTALILASTALLATILFLFELISKVQLKRDWRALAHKFQVSEDRNAALKGERTRLEKEKFDAEKDAASLRDALGSAEKDVEALKGFRDEGDRKIAELHEDCRKRQQALEAAEARLSRFTPVRGPKGLFVKHPESGGTSDKLNQTFKAPVSSKSAPRKS